MLVQSIILSRHIKFWPKLEQEARINILQNLKIVFIFQIVMYLTYVCCLLHLRTFFYDDYDIDLVVQNM
jgi:hypothetical protein